MLRIGDFSQLGQVSIRTLRHYDDLGLLKPARIDRFTDYRYYTIDQLSRLNRILALKDLGFSLDQIKALLDDNVPLEQLRGMLLLKQAELEHHVRQEQERLNRVAARLRQIEDEGHVSPYEVIHKTAKAQTILSGRVIVPTMDDMTEYRCALSHDLYAWLEQARVEPSGHEMVLYHLGEYREEYIDLEMAVGIEKTALRSYQPSMAPRLQLYDLPGIDDMACIVHRGSMYDVCHAIVALYTWVCANGYQPSGAYREIHLFGREDAPGIDYQNLVLELQLPIEKTANMKQ